MSKTPQLTLVQLMPRRSYGTGSLVSSPASGRLAGGRAPCTTTSGGSWGCSRSKEA
jgi:hypothetical protein